MGNPVNYMGNTLTWEGKQLTGYTKPGKVVAGPKVMTYTYDENGLRQTKTADSVTTRYYYNGSALMGQSDGTDTLEFSYDGNGNAVSVKYNGTYYYYLYNGQGDVVKLIDGDGVTQVEYTYDTWGACSVTGSLANTLGAKNPFRYRGYVYDTETRLYYLESRYYDPETGRFISADTLMSTGQSALGYNMFAYCLNNPVNMSDTMGTFSLSTLFSGISLISIGVAAIAVAATILTCGAAAPLMVGVAAVTATAGAATVINGTAEVVESVTGYNYVRDGLMGGNERAYQKQRDTFKLIAELGTAVCSAYVAVTGSVCFTAGTKVTTDTGQKPIEEIEAGDYVMAADAETGEVAAKRVVQTFENETKELVHVTAGGDIITATPEHPFYVPQRGWVGAIELRAGDILVQVNGEYAVVERIEHELLETPVTVYNFEVEGFHTYFVGDAGVLVHNDCIPKDLTPDGSGRKGAFNAAKREIGVPTSQQPKQVLPNINRKGKVVPGRVYDFGNGRFIRDDVLGHIFDDGTIIGRHLNTNRGSHFFY